MSSKSMQMGNSLLNVSRKLGMKTSGLFCNMDNPVGRAVGNALEVKEAIRCLKGQGPPDLEELVVVEGKTFAHITGAKSNH